MQALTLIQAFSFKREDCVPDRDLFLAFSGEEGNDLATTTALVERLKGADFAINPDVGGGPQTQRWRSSRIRLPKDLFDFRAQRPRSLRPFVATAR